MNVRAKRGISRHHQATTWRKGYATSTPFDIYKEAESAAEKGKIASRSEKVSTFIQDEQKGDVDDCFRTRVRHLISTLFSDKRGPFEANLQ
jgi:hypothetical protein